MRDVAIIGVGLTKFGKREENVIQLMAEASIEALRDSRTANEDFGVVFVGNMASGEFEGKSGIANALVSEISLEPAFASKIENTSGSGGAAFYVAWMSVASGQSELALAVGGEKMTSVSTERATDIIASLTHAEEYGQGATLLSFAGLTARHYTERYGAPKEAIAKVAVKNHENGYLNPNAQFQKPITLEQVLTSPIIADPLRLYDFCPITDGAAAIVLVPAERARSFVEKPVRIGGVAGATSTHVVHEREDLTVLDAVRRASDKAYKMAGKGPKDIQVAELHDMFTLMEIIQSEDLGFFRKGEGWKALESGETTRRGALPINTSGGLKAKGHPIGATGTAQVAEITQQLQGRCGARQVKAEVGLTCNVAGFGNNSVVSILERM
ncbi:MAG: thiolase domain-containing protein [Thaumarchaeota archaeon]|nr:thiolase domain-containing protein [Nitrososphaerota archaeon]